MSAHIGQTKTPEVFLVKRDRFWEVGLIVFLFYTWKKPSCLGYIGEYTTQLDGDYNKAWNKDPVLKQPQFHGSFIQTGFLNVGIICDLSWVAAYDLDQIAATDYKGLLQFYQIHMSQGDNPETGFGFEEPSWRKVFFLYAERMRTLLKLIFTGCPISGRCWNHRTMTDFPGTWDMPNPRYPFWYTPEN